jgi:hypothetical protein
VVEDVRAPGTVLKFPRAVSFAIPVCRQGKHSWGNPSAYRSGLDSTAAPARTPYSGEISPSHAGRILGISNQQNAATPNRLERN